MTKKRHISSEEREMRTGFLR